MLDSIIRYVILFYVGIETLQSYIISSKADQTKGSHLGEAKK